MRPVRIEPRTISIIISTALNEDLMKYLALIITLACVASTYASTTQRIYCPSEIICKGSPDSCYVSAPKNYDGNFIFDTYHVVTSDPNGRYTFHSARSADQAICEYFYKDGSTDPHAATKIYYEGKIRLMAEPHNPSDTDYKWVGPKNDLRCNYYDDSNKCRYVVKP